MLRPSHKGFLDIGIRRIRNILRSHKIASMRTLEQKISDAGPYDQRVDPHILTEARNSLLDSSVLLRESRDSGRWYYLLETPEPTWRRRLEENLEPIARRIQTGNRGKLIGQALEIAVYRAIEATHEQHRMPFFGGFRDLDSDDGRLFSKEEPPSIVSGTSLSGRQSLDFATWLDRAAARCTKRVPFLPLNWAGRPPLAVGAVLIGQKGRAK